MDAYQQAMYDAGLRLTDEDDDRKISWWVQLADNLYLRVLYYDETRRKSWTWTGHFIELVDSEHLRPEGNPQDVSYKMNESSPEVFKAVLEAIIKTYRP